MFVSRFLVTRLVLCDLLLSLSGICADRFVRVERWEMREMSEKGLISMEDISRSRTDLAETLHETSEEDDDDDFDDGVSRMR